MLTFFGFVIGAVLVGYGILKGQAPPEIFLNWPGLAIVIGGTIASSFISYPLKEVLRAFHSYYIIFRSGTHNYVSAIDKMVSSVRALQRQGVEVLMRHLNASSRLWILKDGVQMMANGYSKEEAQCILEDQVRWKMAREMKQHQLFGAMARTAPAFGMLGTLIGLINMLVTLQSEPGQVGIGLAIALTTTFYGLVLANMILSPIAEKIKERAEHNLLLETMQIETVVMMYEKRNFVYVRDKLAAYLNASSRKKVNATAGQSMGAISEQPLKRAA